MDFETIKKKYEENKELKFKLYSLDYIIKESEGRIVIYSTLYDNRKYFYISLEELFNQYTVYNVSLMDSIDRMIL